MNVAPRGRCTTRPRTKSVREKALELIGSEEDLKYRKKYATLWKK